MFPCCHGNSIHPLPTCQAQRSLHRANVVTSSPCSHPSLAPSPSSSAGNARPPRSPQLSSPPTPQALQAIGSPLNVIFFPASVLCRARSFFLEPPFLFVVCKLLALQGSAYASPPPRRAPSSAGWWVPLLGVVPRHPLHTPHGALLACLSTSNVPVAERRHSPHLLPHLQPVWLTR